MSFYLLIYTSWARLLATVSILASELIILLNTEGR